jgi:hypothetical protein
MNRYTHKFIYEHECQRNDAPDEDIGEWLNMRAKEIAYSVTGSVWEVSRTRLEDIVDSDLHLYVIEMNKL